MSTAYEIARCPTCNAADHEEVADSEAVRREVEELWGFHLRRLRPGTPERFLADRVFFSQDPPLRLARCAACGTLFRNPRERAREVEELYADEEVDPAVLRGLHRTQRDAYRAQARRLTRLAGGSGTGLEVGSYVGAFLAAADGEGWRFEGVDVNEAANRFARSLGFVVHTGTIHDLPAGRGYDAVAIWNCFDQLPDPQAVVAAARDLLPPGGTLAIRVPNGAFYAALRPWMRGASAPLARALLAHNNLLGFPYRHGFTPRSLGGLLGAHGFEVRRVVGDTLVPIADRWTQPWAAWEERALKRGLRLLLPLVPPPWFEIYARAAP